MGARCLDVRIVSGERQLPPLLGGTFRLPLGERIDAVHRTHRQALVATTAQLGHDHDVGTMVKNRSELAGAVAKAGVAVDAFEHLDADRRILPLGVARVQLNAFGAGGAHRGECRAGRGLVVRSRWHCRAGVDNYLQLRMSLHDDSDERLDDFGFEL